MRVGCFAGSIAVTPSQPATNFPGSNTRPVLGCTCHFGPRANREHDPDQIDDPAEGPALLRGLGPYSSIDLEPNFMGWVQQMDRQTAWAQRVDGRTQARRGFEGVLYNIAAQPQDRALWGRARAVRICADDDWR